MRHLFRSYDTAIESAYILRLKGNADSESYAARCAESCKNIGMTHRLWDAFDGTTDADIVIPEHSQNCSYMSILKIMDNYMTKGEVAIALSHISLWLHCAKIDKPIVVLEHDALMTRRFERMTGYNTIVYLGCIEWAKRGWPMMDIPLHGSDGPNKHFILRAHAYAIDPAVAKNMLAQTLKMGIYAPLDEMMYADLYNISHDGLYAYDEDSQSTVRNRPTDTRTTVKNDDLSF
jgi:GR25 family glycosyltransferase involved in LPS biosynthesis